MDLLTVVCERDLQDMLLQAESIELFVTEPVTHRILIEDGSQSKEWWTEILSRFYRKHNLVLEWSERPEMEPFNEPFNYGYRRQMAEKLKLAAKSDQETVLMLDAKNIFIRDVNVHDWPYKLGNGMNAKLSDKPADWFPRQWIDYIHHRTGRPIPKLVPGSMATPFALTTKYVRDAVNNPEFDELFYDHSGGIPMTETTLYYFYVPVDEIDPPGPVVMGSMNHMHKPADGDWEREVNTSILSAGFYDSPTHGLHRKVRYLMNNQAKRNYFDWLVSLGFDPILAYDYTYFIMTDQTPG